MVIFCLVVVSTNHWPCSVDTSGKQQPPTPPTHTLTPLRMSFLSSRHSMNRQIFQEVPAGSALTSLHSGWSNNMRSLTWRGCPALTGCSTTLSPIYTYWRTEGREDIFYRTLHAWLLIIYQFQTGHNYIIHLSCVTKTCIEFLSLAVATISHHSELMFTPTVRLIF